MENDVIKIQDCETNTKLVDKKEEGFQNDLSLEKNSLSNNSTAKLNNKKVERQSNFELLRIIAMLFIISAHCIVDFSVEGNGNVFLFNRFVYSKFVYKALGQIGVCLFIMISGYFLSKTTFKIQNLLKLILQVTFYSFVSIFIEYLAGVEINLGMLYNKFFVITNVEWWFFSAYIFLYLIHPFINILINNLSTKQLLVFISTIGVFLIIIPTLKLEYAGGYVFTSLVAMLFYYCIGAFIRLNPDIKQHKKIIYAGLILSFCMYLFVLPNYDGRISERESFFVLALSLFIFLAFSGFKFYSKKINFVAKTTFGIYLFHENIGMRNHMWNGVFRLNDFVNKKEFLLIVILAIIIIFIVSCLVEVIRMYLIEKPLFKVLNKSANYKSLVSKVNQFYYYEMIEKEYSKINYKKLLVNFICILIMIFLSICYNLVLDRAPYRFFLLLLSIFLIIKFIVYKRKVRKLNNDTN